METTAAAARSPWRPSGPVVIAFVIGMIVGPMATSYAGLTVTSRTAGARMHDGMLELQASLCDAKARATTADPAKLDATARRELAAKFAQTQSSGDLDYEIVNLCSNKLGG
jgi:hypothetical protein